MNTVPNTVQIRVVVFALKELHFTRQHETETVDLILSKGIVWEVLTPSDLVKLMLKYIYTIQHLTLGLGVGLGAGLASLGSATPTHLYQQLSFSSNVSDGTSAVFSGG